MKEHSSLKMTSFGNFSVFLCAVGDELRLTKEKEERRKKKEEEQNAYF